MRTIKRYFTIAGCALLLAAFVACSQTEKQDADKAEHAGHEMGETAETASHDAVKPWNKYCPVAGGEVDPQVRTVMYEGKAYGFCCEGCDSKFEKEPAKYAKNLNSDGTQFLDDNEG
jgi:YHS domain-containing protein